MTEHKLRRAGESPFNLEALEEMQSKKAPGFRPSKPVHYHEAHSAAKPGRKLNALKEPNPWVKGVAFVAEDEKKPDVEIKPVPLDDLPEDKAPVKEAEPEESLTEPATVSEEDGFSSGEDEKSRVVESVMEQAEAHIEEQKEKRASRFADETIKEIVPGQADKKSDKKKSQIEVVTLGSGVASAIGKGIGGVVDTGKAVAGAAGSGAKAASDMIETGVKSAAGTVINVVKPAKPAKPSGVGGKERVEEDSLISSSAKTANSITEKVADGVLAVGSGVGKITGYVARGAVAAPLDIARGVSGVIVNTTSRITKLFFGTKKKSGRDD